MRINILLFFLFPWLLGIWLFKQDKKLFLRLLPFGMVIANVIDLWGHYNNYWVLKPIRKKWQFITTIPLNLGLYPISGVLMVYLIRKTKERERPSSWIVVFACLLTIFEFTSKFIGWAAYRNGWNLMKTFLAYLTAYYLVHRYYVWRSEW
ncbi:hypothetical protein ACE1TI_00160 [Alteribacillus sp. JSM 102045]|uniref:hypothetical protein n=1 Tax=Alteribacillus sp. JSM 102045 TaxID=1562101 RepID=UPI0035C0BB58